MRKPDFAKLTLWLLLGFIAGLPMCAGRAHAQQVVPIPARPWLTDLFLRNVSIETVIQKVGRVRFQAPGFDPIIFEPTVTLHPGETKWLRRVDLNFDQNYRQVPGCYDDPNPCGQPNVSSAPGMYVWTIDPRLHARVVVTYPGVTTFPLDALTAGVAHQGESLEYEMVGTDFATVKNGVEYPAIGAYPTFLNLGGPVGVTFRVYGADGSDFVDEFHLIGAGITQTGIGRQLPDGGTVRLYLGGPGAGGPGERIPPLYMFIAQSPSDAKQQTIIYGH